MVYTRKQKIKLNVTILINNMFTKQVLTSKRYLIILMINRNLHGAVLDQQYGAQIAAIRDRNLNMAASMNNPFSSTHGSRQGGTQQ